ncbi:hypothetical protein LNQ03_31205 [Klebsiella pneumoniae subsp. pneumoniae]|nr:hypothetical protein [Klebsiella pneumoniae subsp. pneumoniae]
MFILGFSAIPLVNNALLVVIFFALINCAYSVFSTVLKAWFADRLTAEKKRIFSLNYTILNIGWTVGPPIGTLLVMHSINLPFWLAAACAAFPLVFIQLFLQRDGAAAAQPGRRTLVAFGVAARPGAAVVYLLRAAGLLRRRRLRLLSLSQYVLVVASSDFAEKVVAVVLPVNAAVVVVALQYAVGRRLSARNIRPLMTFGTVCFVIGLVGFMFSGASLWAWGDLGGDLHPRGSDLCPRGVYAD